MTESADTPRESVRDALIAVSEKWHTTLIGYDACADICAALGLDPSLPLANVVALEAGEMVVKPAIIATGDTVLAPPLVVTEGQRGFVVVRSAQPGEGGEG